jgi:hypothetical protein
VLVGNTLIVIVIDNNGMRKQIHQSPLGEQISGICQSGEQDESSSEHTCSFEVNNQ